MSKILQSHAEYHFEVVFAQISMQLWDGADDGEETENVDGHIGIGHDL